MDVPFLNFPIKQTRGIPKIYSSNWTGPRNWDADIFYGTIRWGVLNFGAIEYDCAHGPAWVVTSFEFNTLQYFHAQSRPTHNPEAPCQPAS